MKEIESISQFKKWLKQGVKYEAAVKELNLISYEKEILDHNFKGSLFLGCELSKYAVGCISCDGGMVISNRDDIIFELHRSKL